MTAAGRLLLLLLGLGLALGEPASADDEEEEADLQERLTEREDKRRPLEPFTLDVLGHPLTIGGEFELELEPVRRYAIDDEDETDRWLWAQQLQLEAFYTIGEPLSVFVQAQAVLEEDLLGRTVDAVSDRFVERGEMWLYSENVFDSGVSFDVGRLDFEDDRRWWWDEELDAARVAWEIDDVEVTLAVAQELASDRSDRSFVDPEQERVLRVIGEASWDFGESHSFQVFLLHQKDHSPRERGPRVGPPFEPGELVPVDHEDESDASLWWLGLRQTGVTEIDSYGHLGYWLDFGAVFGRERFQEFGDPDDGRVAVEDVMRRKVRGYGLDVGASWLLALPCEPRLFAGYAFGTGSEPDDRRDGAYRQSGVHADEAGFGGVERFHSYGIVLQPELSNLHIATLGVGIAVLRSSSLDLVYHYYRLDERADELRDSALEFELDERNQRLGHGLDLVLALEEWERLEFTIAAGVLRTGSAFADHRREWVVGGLFAVRYGF